MNLVITEGMITDFCSQGVLNEQERDFLRLKYIKKKSDIYIIKKLKINKVKLNYLDSEIFRKLRKKN